MIKRKFKITSSLGTRYVYPVNDSELIYNWKKASDINFVKELKTKLIFRNDVKSNVTDFDFFYELENNLSYRCNDLVCEIYKNCGNGDVLEFKGNVPLRKGIWDLDRCTVSLDLEPSNGIYDCIENNKKDISVIISEYCPFANGYAGDLTTVAPFYLYDNVSGDTVFLDISNLDFGTFNYYAKLYPYGSGGEVRYPFGLFAVLCYNIVKKLLIECGRDYQLPMLRSDYFDWNAKGDTTGYIASSIPPLDLTMVSTSYPTTTYDDRYIFLPKTPGINYYTGQTNRLTHIMFMPKSNANNNSASEWEEPQIQTLDGTSLAIESNANQMTFAELETLWSVMFDAYWFIDTDGCMRVEHSSWFNNTSTTYDSTTGANAKLNEANRKYKRTDNELPRKEIFLFSTNRDKLNGRVDYAPNKNNEILYDNICVTQDKTNDEKTYALPFITTDIAALDSKNNVVTSEFYDNDGLMLFVVEFGTTTDIQTSTFYKSGQVPANNLSEALLNVVATDVYPNAHLQWANLIRRYLKNNRVLSQGKNGAEIISFNASRTIKTKEQVPVLIKLCCSEDFDPTQAQVITSLGTGDILEAEFSTKTNIIKIKTLHD